MKTNLLNKKVSSQTVVLSLILTILIGGLSLYKLGGGGNSFRALTGTNRIIKRVILSAKTTKSLDPKTGMGLEETKVFAINDPAIYVAMQVDKPAKGTKFEYSRYYNDRYVDHNSLKITKSGVKYISFKWALKKATSKRVPGKYVVRLYANGNFEKEVSYIVR